MSIQELIDALIKAKEHTDVNDDVVVRVSALAHYPVSEVSVSIVHGLVTLDVDR